jgi:hypothetical protein
VRQLFVLFKIAMARPAHLGAVCKSKQLLPEVPAQPRIAMRQDAFHSLAGDMSILFRK